MTIQVKVEIQAIAEGYGHLHLALLDVTSTGIRNERQLFYYRTGAMRDENHQNSMEHLSIHEDQALLLCEGLHDFGDGVPQDQRYSVRNPLTKYLHREHPTISLHDELRREIERLEAENLSLGRKLSDANSRLNSIRNAFKP